MTQLGCNYSAPLLAFLADGTVNVDWIKLSRDDTLEQEVAECRLVRPALVHTLGDAGMPPEQFRQIDWDRLNRAIAESHSPHLAIHFVIRQQHMGDPVDEGVALERMTQHILEAQERIRVPLLIENVPWRPGHSILKLCADPANLRRVLEATDTGLLLDTAHVRCAADTLGADPRAYALALPLERVREIHVTGPRLEDGVLRDRHRELQEEDYDLLAWLLERTAPLMVTMEYGGTGPVYEKPGMTDPDALKRQLHRLRGMLR